MGTPLADFQNLQPSTHLPTLVICFLCLLAQYVILKVASFFIFSFIVGVYGINVAEIRQEQKNIFLFDPL